MKKLALILILFLTLFAGKTEADPTTGFLPDPTISNPGNKNQTVCINSPIAAIVFDLTDAESVSITSPASVPAWVSETWAGGTNGTFTITGTPDISGTFSYTVTVSNSHGSNTRSGTITIEAAPTASAGGTQYICHTGTAIVSGASSSNGTILWTHNGAGSLTNSTTISPTYNAVVGDAGNTVTLTMTVSHSPCTAATATYSVVVDPAPTASAGGSQSVCENGSAIVSGASSAHGTILWTHNGAGSLTDQTTIAPTYTAAAADAGNIVTLTMTVTSNCNATTATASYTLNVMTLPTASAGGSQTICQTGTALVSGASSANGTILWTHNGAGSITNATTLTPTYNAAVGDAGNTVTLTMTVSNSPCSNATANYTVYVDPSPIASAGGSQTICQTGTALVSGASSANGTILWTHNGAGSLTNATTITPTYNAVAGDAGNTVTLTMTVTSSNTCNPATATDTYLVYVNATPTASAGGSQTICQTGTALVSGASSANGTILWTHNGAGSLTNATTLTPTYNAAVGDAGNTVTLTMTISNSPCSNATAPYTVFVDPSPIASAGGSQTICQTGTALVSGASSANGTILWTHNGAGSLTNATTITPTYNAVAGDAGNTVTLTITVTSSNTCNPATATDTYLVYVNATPTASAGGSQTICQTGTALVSGASSANGTILWTHNGSGSLTNATTLTPTYNAAVGDAGNTVTLTMTVSNSPCSNATAIYTVFVDPSPIASAGGSQTICQTGTALVSGASSANGTILWTHNGAGSLTNATTLTPTYNAVAGDAGNTVTLTMTVTSTNSCNPATATDTYTVIVEALPTASAGGSQTICQTGTALVSGTSASHGTILWTHNGSGSLTNATTLTPTYTAAAGDAGNTRTLTMTVTSNNSCNPSTVTATYTVIVEPLPTASAGGSQTICQTGTATITGTSASHGTILWTHNGSGSLTNSTTLNPIYTAAAGDAGNTRTLTMTVTSNNSCNPLTATATYTVIVEPLPMASAGGSQSICQTGAALVSGASSANGTILWTHNGAGSLSNATTLTPTYSAVAGDGGHTVTLTMTVTSTNTCTPATATATYTVTVNQLPTLTGASQASTICEGSQATINLLGLLPGVTSTVAYSINSVPQTAVTGVVSNGSGAANFSSPVLTAANNGQILRVTQITTTIPGPNCGQTFTYDVALSVNALTVGGTIASAQSICSGTAPADLLLSGNTGSVIKWEKSLNAGFTTPTDIPVTSTTLTGATIGNLTVDNWFRAVVQSGVCSPTNSASVKITVDPLPVITITGPASVNVTSTGNVYTTQTGKSNYIWSISAGGAISGGGTVTDNTATVTWNTPGAQTVSVNYTITATSCTAVTAKVYNVTVNAKPVASSVTILNDPRSGITLSTFFSYTDADGDLQGTSLYQWYKADDAIGTGSAPIPAATANKYKLKDADTTKYVRFSVTPVALAGATPGDNAVSDWLGPVINDAPTATSVAITGTLNVGAVLIGHYTYSDLEGDLESSSLFQWYISDVLAGPYTAISGEIYSTHLIANNEQGKYFKFHITPKAATGRTTGVEVTSAGYGPANSQPYADALSISGSPAIGSVLTGSYTFHDIDGDLQGTTTFRWLRNGTTPISGAINTTYTLTSADEGFTISFEVTPKSLTGIPNTGTPVSIAQSGPVLDPSVSVPVADQVCISGIRKVNEVLTGKYNYTFYKSEGTSDYRWLRNNLPISGATGILYTITQSDIDSGEEIAFEITPKSSNYVPKVGITKKSNPLARIALLQTSYSLADTAFVLVPNVSGGVFSGKGVSNGYFSPWNADTASKPPHTVNYLLNIVNAVTTCSQQATIDISVVPVNAFFDSRDGFKSVYCYDDKPDTIFVRNVPPAATNRIYNSSNPGSIISIIQDTIIIDPHRKRPGISKDTLYYSYKFKGSYYPIARTYQTDSVGVALINNLDSGKVFCNNDTPFTLYPSLIGAGGVFTGPVSLTVTGTTLLDPSKGLGNTAVVFKFTHASTGCFSRITVPIKINSAPLVSFTPLSSCVASSADTIRFLNSTTSTDPISTWLWEFFDAGGSSTNGLKNPGYLYKIGGDHKVTLKATTTQDCSAIRDTTIGVGFKPVANFYWKNECYHSNDSIMFFDTTSTTAAILSRTWKFGISPVVVKSGIGDAVKNTKFIKADTGYLAVKYIVRTSYSNCNDSITRLIYIRPTIPLLTADYFQNFENGKGGWGKDYEAVNTWSFGKPNRTVIKTAASGNNAWYTCFNVNNQKVESSSVISPCFDFTAIKRPMISLQIWNRFDKNRDGAALQYKIGDTGGWVYVGSLDDGINWYNSSLIKGKPGGDQIGWTTGTKLDQGWGEAKHTIDSLSGKKDVKFRIAYGSDGTSLANEGIAFDDIRIGARSRKVMLEHFTNLTNVTSSNSNSTVTGLATRMKADVINIQYHTNFPGTDAFYSDNPGDASARFLFYGLSRAPYSVIDGGTNSDLFAKIYDYVTVPIDSNDLIRRSMISPSFAIILGTTAEGNIVTINGQIKALGAINAENVTLYLAVTEKKNSKNKGALGETNFYNVFRKFIPDAAGISLQKSWAKDQTYTLTDKTWAIEKISNAADIEVIAFIQNNVTKEIYQSESFVKYSIIVGVDNLSENKGNGFSLYPNPASDRLTIAFETTLQSETDIMIYDYTGTVVRTYKAGSGQDEFLINSLGLKNGIYLVKIKSGGLDWGYKKLVVSGY